VRASAYPSEVNSNTPVCKPRNYTLLSLAPTAFASEVSLKHGKFHSSLFRAATSIRFSVYHLNMSLAPGLTLHAIA
jgi:hypothetical protein